MKKLVYILFFTLFFQAGAMAQKPNGVGKVREKMVEYIQDRLNLSRAEAEKFQPIFLNYFNDLKAAAQWSAASRYPHCMRSGLCLFPGNNYIRPDQ